MRIDPLVVALFYPETFPEILEVSEIFLWRSFVEPFSECGFGWLRCRNMLSDWGKSAASLASQATATVKATTNDLAGNVDLTAMGNAAYERAERARQAATDLAAAQNLDEVGGKLSENTTAAANMFGSYFNKAVSVASEGLKQTSEVVGGTAGGGWWGQGGGGGGGASGGGGNRTAEELAGPFSTRFHYSRDYCTCRKPLKSVHI